ncbi:MAG: ArsR family transcriptional regulator [Calditrichales bacterium]|nr:MAG: ArsR family transcriptional regulator [Calditrichales bacterium]
MEPMVIIFRALSDKSRIRIIKMLEIRPLCVCEITAVLGLATSTVSKHLSILREAGLISDKKEGKWVNYELNREQGNGYVRQLLPLLHSWLSDDRVVLQDLEKVNTIDRNQLCGI